ncbi:hypothetical protein EV194_103120 [Natronoflexus pectinivorans]|uniref:Uncharacterized protein n=1 Tax=Natronoflexus pectinivorans TaxID=682526 RepID=A0A4R2GKK4_9BACT|nr:hypothetical protein EV194_103120 [Natronoflexus pectinivorans]
MIWSFYFLRNNNYVLKYSHLNCFINFIGNLMKYFLIFFILDIYS